MKTLRNTARPPLNKLKSGAKLTLEFKRKLPQNAWKRNFIKLKDFVDYLCCISLNCRGKLVIVEVK